MGDFLRGLIGDTPSTGSPPQRRPEYVYTWNRPGQGGFQPIECQGVTGYLFAVQAQRDAVQALLDRWLNTPAGGAVHYIALTDLVLLTFDTTQKLIPTNPRFGDLGWTPETEASIWMLAGATRPGMFGSSVLERLVFFVPHIFVKEWPAIWGGREVYGFPKEQGWLSIPDGPVVAEALTADVVGATVFTEHTEWVRSRLLDVNPVSASTPPTPSDLDELLRSLQALVGNAVIPGGFSLIAQAWEALTRHEFPMVFLKQIVDASDGTFASYQAIIEAPVRVQKVRTLHTLSQDFQLVIHPLESHPLETMLGLQSTQAVRKAFWVDFDFDIGNATTVWEARWTGA